MSTRGLNREGEKASVNEGERERGGSEEVHVKGSSWLDSGFFDILSLVEEMHWVSSITAMTILLLFIYFFIFRK